MTTRLSAVAGRFYPYVHVRGVAAPTVDAFETPLGRVLVDVEDLVRFPTCHLSLQGPPAFMCNSGDTAGSRDRLVGIRSLDVRADGIVRCKFQSVEPW